MLSSQQPFNRNRQRRSGQAPYRRDCGSWFVIVGDQPYNHSHSCAEPKIRLTVLSALHERFDKHLAQAENVRSLFIALNDEHFENRMAAVGLIGRLALHNPAYVMPSLRKALIQLLTELEYSTVM